MMRMDLAVLPYFSQHEAVISQLYSKILLMLHRQMIGSLDISDRQGMTTIVLGKRNRKERKGECERTWRSNLVHTRIGRATKKIMNAPSLSCVVFVLELWERDCANYQGSSWVNRINATHRFNSHSLFPIGFYHSSVCHFLCFPKYGRDGTSYSTIAPSQHPHRILMTHHSVSLLLLVVVLIHQWLHICSKKLGMKLLECTWVIGLNRKSEDIAPVKRIRKRLNGLPSTSISLWNLWR